MPENFPDNIPVGKDIDILVNPEDYSALTETAKGFASDYEKIYDLTVVVEEHKTRIRFEKSKKLILQIDTSRKLKEFTDKFIPDAVEARESKDGYYILSGFYEYLYRFQKYSLNKKKTWHLKYLEKYIEDFDEKSASKYGSFNIKNFSMEKRVANVARMLFTSESVTEGHPDKVADRISDSILDEILERDPEGRVACETVVTTGQVHVVGEISTTCYVDITKTIRNAIRDIGYTHPEYGFDAESVGVLISLDEQSPDIAQGVNRAIESREGDMAAEEAIGAGDQGMMFGYATNETPEFMPLPISLAHKLAYKLAEIRKVTGELNYLRPDGKTQVTIVYEDGKPVAVDTIVISTQHDPTVTVEQIKADMIKYVIKPVVPEGLITPETKYFVNPTGKFVIGGPHGDSGLTGRKIIVDTYGGWARHGGGAFSGKDPTKVDRSASYAARYVAKNIVAAGLAEKCEIQLAYAIGVAHPVSIRVETFGTNKIDEKTIEKLVKENFDLRPAGIIKMLNLRRPIYKQTSAYGHFGRTDIDLPWERTDKAEILSQALK